MSAPQPPTPPSGPHGPGHGRPSDEHPRLAEASAWSITAYLLGGLITYGGIGWLLDRWLGTSFLVLVGLLVGMGLALYIVWFRYGTR